MGWQHGRVSRNGSAVQQGELKGVGSMAAQVEMAQHVAGRAEMGQQHGRVSRKGLAAWQGEQKCVGSVAG